MSFPPFRLPPCTSSNKIEVIPGSDVLCVAHLGHGTFGALPRTAVPLYAFSCCAGRPWVRGRGAAARGAPGARHLGWAGARLAGRLVRLAGLPVYPGLQPAACRCRLLHAPPPLFRTHARGRGVPRALARAAPAPPPAEIQALAPLPLPSYCPAGETYRGRWHESDVAVKCLNPLMVRPALVPPGGTAAAVRPVGAWGDVARRCLKPVLSEQALHPRAQQQPAVGACSKLGYRASAP